MTDSNVTAIFGGPSGKPEVNELCVEALEEWLEMARAGEIVGVGLVGLCSGFGARYDIRGRVGGYSMLGASEMLRQELIGVNASLQEDLG